MHEFNDELDGRAIALLELYRDAGAPPPEVEDRLLARIEAQAAIEADLEGEEHELIGAEPQPATETGVRPLTAVLIAIVAFAAGVALTVGLRAQVAHLVEDPFEPSVAPMTAEDPPAREIAVPPPEGACGAIVIEEEDDALEPEAGEDVDAVEDEELEEGEPTPPAFVPAGDDEAPIDEPEHVTVVEEPGVDEPGVTWAPWAGPSDEENEPQSSSSKRGSRSTRVGGYWAPASRSSSSSSSSPSSRPSSNGGARGPSTPKPSGGGNGKPVGNNGGGDRPPPPKPQPDPSTPPVPSPDPGGDEPPPPDDRPDEPPPTEPEPEPDWDQCEYEQAECNDAANMSCAYDPDSCPLYYDACAFQYEQCPVVSCDQTYIDCLTQVDTMCLQQDATMQEDPELQELCMQLYDQCSTDYVVCLGYGDDEAEPEPGQGVQLDEYP